MCSSAWQRPRLPIMIDDVPPRRLQYFCLSDSYVCLVQFQLRFHPVRMGTIRQLWLKWKMLKLPWRKTFLVGMSMLILCDLNHSYYFQQLTQRRPGSSRQYVLGIQRQVECPTFTADCPLPAQHSLRRRQNIAAVA